MIGVRHDGYHVAYSVSSSRGGHSRPASVPFNFGFFLYRYCYCYCFVTSKVFKPRRVCGIASVRGIRFQSLFPTGVFWFFVSVGVTVYLLLVYSGRSCLPLVRGQSSQNKPNGL